MMLLAATNMICLEVASFPFLWVLPLSLYLLTFILCFAGKRWYSRPLYLGLALLSGLGVAALRYRWTTSHAMGFQLLVYLTAMFSCCMVVHGETYRLRPEPERLTLFYLVIATGGALGGFMVAVVAPLVFRGYWELYIALPACLALGLAAVRPTSRRPYPHWRRYRDAGIAAIVCAGAALLFVQEAAGGRTRVLARTRNFYGVLRVQEVTIDARRGGPDVELVEREVFNGPIGHGSQVSDVRLRGGAMPPSAEGRAALASWLVQARALPTTYYGEQAGGMAMLFHPAGAAEPRRIGIVGLGAGTLALYGQRGDSIRYFEINPDVVNVADRYFTYLSDCRKRGVHLDVVLGDGRLMLQREAPKSFDILVVDAFTGDAIPVHMLTEEAFELYLDRLKDDGVLSIHVTNMHLDLRWVVARIARTLHVPAALIHNEPERGNFLAKESDWVLLSRNPRFIDSPAVRPFIVDERFDLDGAPLWTDEYSSLFAVLRGST
jgi:Spermine/spermidine synthase domain